MLSTQLNDKDHGIVFLDGKKDRAQIKPLLKQYFVSEEYEKNTDYFKVIAWKNKTVAYINDVARELVYGEMHKLNKFIPGESLIVMKPVFLKNEIENTAYYKVVFNTSEEITIRHVTVKPRRFSEGPFSLSMKVYELAVESFDPSDPLHPYKNTIYVVHEESAEEYMKLQEAAKKVAMTTKDGRAWVRYFNIMKWSANVGYNYAITGHKSQGSTYKNVLVLEEDIDQNRKIVERNRIKYTVYSRATDKLFVLRENYPALV
jgi:hypothetical protein